MQGDQPFSVAFCSGGCARAHPPGVAPEASEEWFDSSEVLMPHAMLRLVWLFPSCELAVARVHGRVPSSRAGMLTLSTIWPELGPRPCTRATASSHEGTTRPAEALREVLRPRRSVTTPPRPRGLHPAGALARTHRNKMQSRKAGPLAKKCDKSLQASIKTPFEARGLLSGTIIRGTLKTPNSQLVTPISIKLQRPDGCD